MAPTGGTWRCLGDRAGGGCNPEFQTFEAEWEALRQMRGKLGLTQEEAAQRYASPIFVS